MCLLQAPHIPSIAFVHAPLLGSTNFLEWFTVLCVYALAALIFSLSESLLESLLFYLIVWQQFLGHFFDHICLCVSNICWATLSADESSSFNSIFLILLYASHWSLIMLLPSFIYFWIKYSFGTYKNQKACTIPGTLSQYLIHVSHRVSANDSERHQWPCLTWLLVPMQKCCKLNQPGITHNEW